MKRHTTNPFWQAFLIAALAVPLLSCFACSQSGNDDDDLTVNDDVTLIGALTIGEAMTMTPRIPLRPIFGRRS